MTRILSEMIEEVILLQPSYDSKNTPDMKRRGLLIRNEITGYFRDRLPALKGFVPSVDDLTVHGKDGMGPKRRQGLTLAMRRLPFGKFKAVEFTNLRA